MGRETTVGLITTLHTDCMAIYDVLTIDFDSSRATTEDLLKQIQPMTILTFHTQWSEVYDWYGNEQTINFTIVTYIITAVTGNYKI